MNKIVEVLRNFQEDRPSMDKDNTVEKLAILFIGETDETIAEFDKYFKGETTKQKVFGELADVIIFSLNIIDQMGGDAEKEIMEKIGFNNARYPAGKFKNGTEFVETLTECRQETKEMGLNEIFYDEFTGEQYT